MQEDVHIFQGMKRDNHQIRQDGKFLWDAHNIRITNREDNTLLSITNEKGTSDPLLTFEGYYVGHCVIGKYLVVFTSAMDGSNNYIYRVEREGTGYKSIILYYNKEEWKNSWSPKNPIETLGIYESDSIQKVYWVDGINQPRVINVVKPEAKIPIEYIKNGINLSLPNFEDGTPEKEWWDKNFPNGLFIKDSFNFTRKLSLKEHITVEKLYGYGEFSAGTIQYAISYYSRYEQESNICYTTPLYYISYRDRGGDGNDKISNSFKIKIENPDKNFDYARIYSIHRTTINSTPTVKVVGDIPISNADKSNVIQLIDTGIIGYTIDDTQLLYIGGEYIVPKCMTQKDNTLFLGNIRLPLLSTYYRIKTLLKDLDIEWNDLDVSVNNKENINGVSDKVYYSYTTNLSKQYSGRFKTNEVYRCGLQFQTENGKWLDPIHIVDQPLCVTYPWESPNLLFSSKSLDIIGSNNTGIDIFKELRELGVKKVRACVVFPNNVERDIICQGVLCPTVFNIKDRTNNSGVYAMSSWFFRPAYDTAFQDNNLNVYNGASIQFKHNEPLYFGGDRGAEIQNMGNTPNLEDITNPELHQSSFLVDENVVTFHSPDVEFDPALSNYSWDDVHLKIIGVARLGAIAGDINIKTSSATVNNYAGGFIHNEVGYPLSDKDCYISGGLTMGLFYEDSIINTDFQPYDKVLWAVYPWNRQGSLNNDTTRPADKGAQSAVLSNKIISNLKFFNSNKVLGGDTSPININISTPQLFSSNEVQVLKIPVSYLNTEIIYMGNVDKLLTTSSPYNPYYGYNFDDKPQELTNSLHSFEDPVRMKYKSSKHLVFSLGNNSEEIQLLPRHITIGETLGGQKFSMPTWYGFNNIINRGTEVKEIYLYSGVEITKPPFSDETTNRVFINIAGGHYSYASIIDRANGNYTYNTITYYKSKLLVLKATKGITRCNDPNILLPGTTEEDYNTNTIQYPDGSYETIYIYNKDEDLYYVLDFRDPNDIYSSIIATTPPNSTSNGNDVPDKLFVQNTFGDIEDRDPSPYLLIGELVRNTVIDKFGGDSESTLLQNIWLPAGEPVSIERKEGDTSPITVPFEYGDTWYSRYDCLKTYPFTQNDENSVVEIGSFMCETRVNIDGRTDRNRGNYSNLTMSPLNFNLFNEIYSQKDNYFSYVINNDDYYKLDSFSNQIAFSKEKQYGEEVDTWTGITAASTTSVNGDKDEITALTSWNEYLLCFQSKAFSRILFNSRVQIPTSDGVPIEVSNNYKVDGSRAINSSIGCNNKWSIINTSTGVYFIDSNSNSIYVFNGQLTNLSDTKGMSQWVKEYAAINVWKPYTISDINGIRTFYDNKYSDVYFTTGPMSDTDPQSLCYSEKLGQFTSFMSYGGTQAMFNFDEGFYSLKEKEGRTSLYQNNVGNYNSFYGKYEGWDISFISNGNPLYTKIFDTVDIKADYYQTYGVDTEQLLNICPINFVRASNEYQDSSISSIDSKNTRKKFRIWRTLMPRNFGTRQRIRNPWAMITLGWNPDNQNEIEANTRKAVIHDITVKYTI